MRMPVFLSQLLCLASLLLGIIASKIYVDAVLYSDHGEEVWSNRMSEENPVVASSMPAVIRIEPGEYWWCSCGKSSKQPFCDGSHKGTSFTPQKVEISESQNTAFCNCKHSGNGPFCDGAHSSLPKD